MMIENGTRSRGRMKLRDTEDKEGTGSAMTLGKSLVGTVEAPIDGEWTMNQRKGRSNHGKKEMGSPITPQVVQGEGMMTGLCLSCREEREIRLLAQREKQKGIATKAMSLTCGITKGGIRGQIVVIAQRRDQQ
jgi:hypothetical protein